MATKRTASRARGSSSSSDRLGVWVFGAQGGLATTMIVGALALAKGLTGTDGLLTETPLCEPLALAPFRSLVFGGHEIRGGTLWASAQDIHAQTGTIPTSMLDALKKDLAAVDKEIKPGTLVNAGAPIRALAQSQPRSASAQSRRLRDEVDRLREDIRSFMKRHRLERCVCVNLISTETILPVTAKHRSLAAFERLLDMTRPKSDRFVRPSTLYGYVAASLRLPLIHFTPSNGALVPAIRALFDQNKTPYMGADGKTGETLVKSSLAPMFRYRNLRVLTWQGYNILGDRDGAILAHAAHKKSKVRSKDALLPRILGYPLHTHVGIDYVPSLHDMKTAWDFIHFRGFLGFKMVMQFIWQGCDAILAAPLVLDLLRFADLARRRNETGAMTHLACFFKSPLDVAEHDLHGQWQMLTEYVRNASGPQSP